MLNITEGKIKRAEKVVIYGSEGIGKTTIAAQFPNPLFIDTEGGTAQLDVRRIDRPQSWEELLTIIKEVAATPNICKTLVLDTADWAEALCMQHVCEKNGQKSIESFGYGKGYTYLAEEFGRLIKAFDKVIDSGTNVVITAHAKMRKFEQPDEQGAYDRWEMKLSKQVAPLVKEWCDMLLFANYKTYVVTTDNNTKKGQGGKRVIYTSHHPCWDAKNRHGLPAEMELDFKNLAHLFGTVTASPQPTPATQTTPPQTQSAPDLNTPMGQLRMLMERDKITESDIQTVAYNRGQQPPNRSISEYPDSFITGWVIRYWKQIKDQIKESNKNG